MFYLIILDFLLIFIYLVLPYTGTIYNILLKIILV